VIVTPVRGISPANAPAAPQRVPVGVLTGACAAAILLGGLGAKLLHDAYPTWAVIIAPLLGVGQYVLVYFAAKAEEHPSVHGAIALSATCFASFYFVALAGETWHPLRSSEPLVRVIQVFTLVARILGAAALGVVIGGVAIWQGAGEALRKIRPGAVAPLLVTVSLATGAFTLSMAILLMAIALLPRAASLYGLVVLLFILPIVLHGLCTYVYGRLLSRWEIAAVPSSLITGLAELRSRSGFQFDRVICLDASYGNGRLAAVARTPRAATLIISEPLTNLLASDELLAILAHETAHIELRHFQRKLLFGLLATGIGFGCYVLVFMALNRVIPREMHLAPILVLMMLGAFGRQSYEALVTRRHEREADEYAANAVGAGALLRALDRLGAGRSPIVMANRWTTHSTWEIRSRRLRDMAAREERGDLSVFVSTDPA
jgi:Zn-dependent protease with chaperone function